MSSITPLGTTSQSTNNSDGSQSSHTQRISNFVFFKSPLPDEVTIHTLNFLEAPQLRVMDSVNKHFQTLITKACERECKNKIFPPNISAKQWTLQFPNAMGIDCIQEYIGDVEESDKMIPIPKNHIENRKLGRNNVPVPEYFIREVDENSPLELDETTAVGNNKARLIENQEKMGLEPTDKTKILKIPNTPRNMILLFEKYLKKNLPSRFAGINQHSWQNVLDQHGDVGTGPTHWSCQDADVYAFGESYDSQAELAGKEGLEIVPLGDRIFFQLLTDISTGKIPQKDHIERTSTPTLDDDGDPRQSAIWWSASGPLFRLFLPDDHDYSFGVGVAVGVPAGSSKSIGH